MRVARRLILSLFALALLGGIALAAIAFTRARPQDTPWAALDLSRPVGMFTGRKLAALGDEADECRALLDRAGARFEVLPPFGSGSCVVADGVRLGGGSRTIVLRPDSPAVSCPVAAALAVWEWEIVQPAARRAFGRRVEAIDHLGAYSCRRISGSAAGGWSEHATGDAIDIAGFGLEGGRRVSVLADWRGDDDEAAFLREIRDGACGLFATVLSPDYNAAHADHLHLDQAGRGATGWRGCG